MLPCPKCGYDNELGRIFCHQCGQKLDLDAIKPPSRGGKPLRPKNTQVVRQWIRRIVEFAILGIILYGVFLLIQVVPEPPQPSPAERAAADKKWLAVEKLVHGKAANSVEISEAEATAWLASLKISKRDAKWGIVPDRMWMRFVPHTVELNMLATLRMGGALEKRVWLTYTGTPKTQNGQFLFEASGGTFGRLKLPPALVEYLGVHRETFAEMFKHLMMEKHVLSQVTRIEVQADRVILHYQPR